MNYSNTSLRIRRTPARPEADAPTAMCLVSDRRGTHLRLRKVGTRARRTRPLAATALAVLLASASMAAAQFQISTATGLFTPSFRSTLTLDAGQTTWFGWTGNIDGIAGSADDGGFDGVTLNNLIDNPAPILGAGGLDGMLSQVGLTPILASTKNIYAGSFATGTSIETRLTLQIPTNGTPGIDGFTTIILQGSGFVTGAGTQLPATPGTINGVQPTMVSSPNAIPGRQQWWAKYEIPGNAANYTVEILLPGGPGINPTSVRELVVDTQFSTGGYAPDTAAVPEPGSASLFAVAACGVLARRRRK